MGTKVVPFKDSQLGKKQQVEQMFDDIANRYDFLNHFLSAGIDYRWRQKAINMIAHYEPQALLDVATGTADFALDAHKVLPQTHITGIDISAGMLEKGAKKIKKEKLESLITLRKEDSENLSFEDETFDATMCAFGVRNFENLSKGLSEMYRVTKSGGVICILEFSDSVSFPMKQIFGLYFRYILPTLGKLVSKNATAYSYLPESVEAFPHGQAFLDILNSVGYKNTICKTLTFGVASIYIGEK